MSGKIRFRNDDRDGVELSQSTISSSQVLSLTIEDDAHWSGVSLICAFLENELEEFLELLRGRPFVTHHEERPVKYVADRDEDCD